MPHDISPMSSGGRTPPDHASVPQFIQFRWNGVNLGGPDASVVDFVGGSVVVTRGTGDDADKITVSFGA